MGPPAARLVTELGITAAPPAAFPGVATLDVPEHMVETAS